MFVGFDFLQQVIKYRLKAGMQEYFSGGGEYKDPYDNFVFFQNHHKGL